MTAADEHVKNARSRIDYAAKDVAAVVVERCWGSDEYKRQRMDDLTKALNLLLEVRGLLGWVRAGEEAEDDPS